MQRRKRPAAVGVLGALAAVGVLWSQADGGPGGKVAHANTFSVVQTFLDPTPGFEEKFGFSVAAVGSNVLVGAPDDNTGATDTGAAYLFDGTTGALLHTFLNPTPDDYDSFGSSVAALGTNVLVGAPDDDAGALNAGAAYLFDGATGALLHTFLNPAPGPFGDRFGFSLAGVGGNVLVGAPYDSTGSGPENSSGMAYLFDGATGDLVRTVPNPTPYPADYFGISVAAMGTDFVVGATGAEEAYLFDGATGTLLQTFHHPSPTYGDYFGSSVAAVGSNVLVGAPRDDTGASSAGAAYLFDGATGAVLQAFLNPAPTANDRFGFSVAGLGSNVLVGAPFEDKGAADAGAVYLFDGATGGLLQTFGKLVPADLSHFGSSVAAVGSNVLVGAPREGPGATHYGEACLLQTLTNGGDGDKDGCSDIAEQQPESDAMRGGGRNPAYFWDFFDTPDPNGTPQRDRMIRINDLMRVLSRYGEEGDRYIDPLSMPPKTGYHPAYDRGGEVGPDPWDMGPPDGHINIVDVYAVVAQYGHDCR